MSELKAISSGEIYNIIEYEGSCITDDLYYPKAEADKVIAHNKYKRCLAMAKWCDDAARLATWDKDYHRCGWYNKWMLRWLKIAEQFKEVK